MGIRGSKPGIGESKGLPKTDSGAEDIDLAAMEKYDEGYLGMKQISFDPDIVFQFYSKSSGKPKPGKGSGEKIGKGKTLEFATLAAIPEWRKVLSNFYKTAEPMQIDDLKVGLCGEFLSGIKI